MGTDSLNREAEEAAQALERLLRSSRELLGMEIAWIAEIREGRQVFRALEGESSPFGLSEGDEMPVDETYCRRIELGELPGVIPDMEAVEAGRHMPVTAKTGIASFVSVPIELANGTVFGTLCCASQRPNAALSERDLKFLERLARQVAMELEDHRYGPSSVAA